MFESWRLDEGLASDTSEQRKHKLDAYKSGCDRIGKPVYLTEPKACSEFRGLTPKSSNEDQSAQVLLIPGASNQILKYSQEAPYIWGKPTSKRAQNEKEEINGSDKIQEQMETLRKIILNLKRQKCALVKKLNAIKK